MQELLWKPIEELASLIKSRDITAKELVEASLARIDSADSTINAFLEVDSNRALTSAATITAEDPRPFAGVPIAIKGNVPIDGLRLNFASAYLGDYRANRNAYIIDRLERAGFVIVGTTNLPEFGILPTTEPRHTGPTLNPWDLSRTPGGSSGGSAAAVAAGMVPIAHGNDGGGSIRIPAACCGLVGLKPSRGRISYGPFIGDSFLATHGVLSRTVGETAQLMDILSGYEPGDATWTPQPDELYSSTYGRDPGRLRIAMTTNNVLDVKSDPECVAAYEEAGRVLNSLGHDVIEISPNYPSSEILWSFTQAFSALIGLGIQFGEVVTDRLPREDEVEPLSWIINELAKATSSIDYVGALTQLNNFSRKLIPFFDEFDVLLTPALAERPVPIGEIHGCGEDPMADFARSGRFTPYTSPCNITGQPAISIPIRVGEDGLPTSVQLIGRPLAEDVLLQVAAQIESVCSVGNPPALVAS